MNYRHGFHAGSAADVFKHALLAITLERLLQKPKALFVLDTHAASGLYRLAPAGEAQDGIARLWPHRAQWPGLAPYLDVVARHNATRLRIYPGSPVLASALLRPQDRLVAVESDPQAHAHLVRSLEGPRRQAFWGDGYQALKALLPPPERRALILIDPPYERAGERAALLAGLTTACRRFRQGVYLIWYPIKDRREADRLGAALARFSETRLQAELLTLPPDVHNRLNGSGLMILNPPFGLKDAVGEVLPGLAHCLTRDGIARYRLL